MSSARASLGTGREVSEGLYEALLTEMGAHYATPGAVMPCKVMLESIGYQVGLQLCERCGRAVCCLSAPLTSGRYARDKPRFLESLDAIKFLCKEFWHEAFKKQVDNLKTNYRARRGGEGSSTLTSVARGCMC